jgi:hypothetical protein
MQAKTTRDLEVSSFLISTNALLEIIHIQHGEDSEGKFTTYKLQIQIAPGFYAQFHILSYDWQPLIEEL